MRTLKLNDEEHHELLHHLERYRGTSTPLALIMQRLAAPEPDPLLLLSSAKKPMRPAAVAELEDAIGAGCQVPGCTHAHHETLHLMPRCHRNVGVDVSYTKGTGVLRIACNKCDKVVLVVAVALI